MLTDIISIESNNNENKNGSEYEDFVPHCYVDTVKSLQPKDNESNMPEIWDFICCNVNGDILMQLKMIMSWRYWYWKYWSKRINIH